MTIKIHGEREEQARTLLDGQEPTQEKIGELLAELEQRRAADAARAASPPVAEDRDKRLEAALAAIEMMQAKISDLSRRTDAGTEGQDIMAGKLPVNAPPAPPQGLTGFNAIPRDVWIKTPFGNPGQRQIDFKICGCKDCATGVMHHYFCSMCHAGPYHMRQTPPIFAKTVFRPGTVWGLNHYACSDSCRKDYLAKIGVIAGVNDHEPPVVYESVEAAQAAQTVPQRPVVAHGSD